MKSGHKEIVDALLARNAELDAVGNVSVEFLSVLLKKNEDGGFIKLFYNGI